MGGCATKPKVLKGDQKGEVLTPEAAKKEAAAPAPVTSETKEVMGVDDQEGDNKKVDGDCGGEITEVNETVEHRKVDDQANKRPSLSNLVKEEKQDDVNVLSLTVKEPKEAEIKQIEVDKSGISVEHSTPAEFVDAPEKSDSEKTPRVATTDTNQSSEKTDVDETKSSEQKTQDANITTSEIKPEDNLKSSEIKT